MAKHRPKTGVVVAPPQWQQNFKTSTIKVGFCLNLTRAMLEFLCATADDVNWDRALFGDIHYPDNWMATGNALFKRGLVERKSQDEIGKAWINNQRASAREECSTYWRLTPAGLKVVELLKVTGMFIVADSSHYKKQA